MPVDGSFYDSGKTGIDNGYTNVKYTLVMGEKVKDNIKALYEFIFLDEEETSDPEDQSDSDTETPTN